MKAHFKLILIQPVRCRHTARITSKSQTDTFTDRQLHRQTVSQTDSFTDRQLKANSEVDTD